MDIPVAGPPVTPPQLSCLGLLLVMTPPPYSGPTRGFPRETLRTCFNVGRA